MLPHPSSHWKADTDFQNNYWCHLSVTSWQMIVFLFCKMVTLKELIIISKLHLYTFKDVSQKHIFYTSENDKYGFTHLMFSKCCLYLLKLFHCTAIMKYLILLLYKLSILVSIGWYSHRLQHNHMLKGPMKSFRKIKLNTPTHTCMHTHTAYLSLLFINSQATFSMALLSSRPTTVTFICGGSGVSVGWIRITSDLITSVQPWT